LSEPFGALPRKCYYYYSQKKAIVGHCPNFLMSALRKLSLRVRRFFVPIIGWHKPYFTPDFTPDIPLALRQFRSAFIPAFLFGATRDIVTVLTDVNNIPYNGSAIALDALFTGVELSAFPLVNTILIAKFSPKLKTRGATLAWTAGASFATAVAIHAVRTPVLSVYNTGRFTIKDWFDRNGAVNIVSFTAFTTGVNGLDRSLPPPERMGGKFAREAVVTALADVGGVVASAPLVVGKTEGLVTGTLRRCLTTLPLALLDFGMLKGITVGCNRWLPATGTVGK
jgi:hypothetical protein